MGYKKLLKNQAYLKDDLKKQQKTRAAGVSCPQTTPAITSFNIINQV